MILKIFIASSFAFDSTSLRCACFLYDYGTVSDSTGSMDSKSSSE